MCYFLGDDKPVAPGLPIHTEKKSSEATLAVTSTEAGIHRASGEPEIIHVEPEHTTGGNPAAQKLPVWRIMGMAITNYNVPLLMLQYACCFGVELAVDSAISHYFIHRFDVNQTVAGYLASIFGMMNIFSRASGGFLSDYAARKWGMRGRLWVQEIGFICNAASLIAFSYADSMGSSVGVLVLFSYFTQAGCGSTFGIVPFVVPHIMGAVSGLVGAGGNLGGAIFNVVFTIYVDDPRQAFRIMGYVVLIAGALFNFLVRVQGQSLLSGRKMVA